MKVRTTLKVLTASLLLASCAQTQTKQNALNIQPLQEVRHSLGHAKAQYELGRYYHGQLRYGLAIESYRRALAIDPGMVDAMNAVGAAYAESGNLGLARAQFKAALKLQPESAYTHNNLGYVDYLAGDYPAAVQAYKQALRLDTKHQKARQNLILALEKMRAGDQIANTVEEASVVAETVPAVEGAQRAGAQSSWVKVSPVIYEIRSTVAPVARDVAATRVKGADTAPVAKLEAARAPAPSNATGPAAMQRAARIPPTPVPQVSVAAQVGEAKSHVMIAVKATPRAVVTQNVTSPTMSGVEVSNGNGVRGMAAMVARYFSTKGVQQARLTNEKPFVERRTRIEFRPGNEAEAAKINSLLPKGALLVASSKLRPGIKVRLVLGHDLGHSITAWDNQSEAQHVTAGLTRVDRPQL